MSAPLPIEGAVPSAGNELPTVVYAECYCGRVEAFNASAGAPAGWRVTPTGDRAWCPDCNYGADAELALLSGAAAARLSAEPPLFAEIANDNAEQLILIPSDAATGGHHGCRILHSIVSTDAVVLRIHAGAKPVGATDDRPILFLARRCDLRELITHLEVISSELNEGAVMTRKIGEG